MTAIADVMTHDVTVVAPEADIQQAARLMRDRDIGALPVYDGKQLLGIVTDRDIAVRATARGVAPSAGRVADVMSRNTAWCFDDQTVGEVLQQMGDQQIRRIPVVSRDSMELAGMVSLGDLAIRQKSPIESTLEDISRPVPLERQATGKQPDGP